MYRVGHGYDSHRFAEGGPLRLGGIDLEENYHLVGHSDGDAIVHALCDAVLGALGDGDIGNYFPDTDAAYQDADSLTFLRSVGERLRIKNYQIINADITVVTEKPRLADHKKNMCKVLAPPLHLTADQINIKASTNEGMGFIGRGEGLAVWAIVIVQSIN